MASRQLLQVGFDPQTGAENHSQTVVYQRQAALASALIIYEPVYPPFGYPSSAWTPVQSAEAFIAEICRLSEERSQFFKFGKTHDWYFEFPKASYSCRVVWL